MSASLRLERLRKMGPHEILGRVRQGASKWIECHLGEIPIPARDSEMDPARLCTDLECFREAARKRFFDGVASGITPRLMEEHFPAALARMHEAAEAIGRGRFDLLGYRGLDFGEPIDWHLDPISRRRAPLRHWTRINPLDAGKLGDVKVIWELNRHQWLVPLGQTYRLTGDERPARVFAKRMREWLAANPEGFGINWTSGLEMAFRIIAWCWALALFRDSPSLTPELFGRMRAALRAQAVRVERYLSRYTAPNTHLTGEALGLVYAGTLFPGFPDSERWRRLGRRILAEEFERQVLPDGVYFEQSSCYQRYTLEIGLHLLALERRSGRSSASVADGVRRMLDFFLMIQRGAGSLPQVGDSDGGWLLPLAPRRPHDARGIFSTAAALLGRTDCAWAAGGFAPETLWLLGPAGEAAFRTLSPAPPRASAARAFESAGYIVMRSGWSRDDHVLLFDAGPLGFPRAAGHAHADLLSIECSVWGEPCLVDPGTGVYAADPAWRDHFRGTAAHSTVTVDAAGQAVAAGPFAWRDLPRARLRHWISNDRFDLADAEHDAYRRLPDPVTHRRRVLFVRPRFWVVVDDLVGREEHRIEARFQFAPLRVVEHSDGWVCAVGSRGRGLFLRAFGGAPLRQRIVEGSIEPRQGWISPDYGERRPSPVLILSASTRLPLRILTLLVPMAEESATPPEVSVWRREGERPDGLVLGSNEERIVFEDDGVRFDPLPTVSASTAIFPLDSRPSRPGASIATGV